MHTALCNRCGMNAPVNLPACLNCGAPAFVVPSTSAAPSGCRTTINIGGGFLLLLLGLVIFVFARGHDPLSYPGVPDCNGFICLVNREPGSPWFFGGDAWTKIMIAAGFFALLGLLGVIQGFILQAKARA